MFLPLAFAKTKQDLSSAIAKALPEVGNILIRMTKDELEQYIESKINQYNE